MKKFFLDWARIMRAPEGVGGGSGEDVPNDGGDAGENNDAGDGDEGGDADDGDGDEGGDKPAKPSDKEAELLRDVMKKKGAIKDLKAQLAEQAAQIKRFEGIDPEKVREMIAANKQAEERALEKKGEFDTLRQRMADEHRSVVETKDTEIADLKAQLESQNRMIANLTVGASFDGSKFIANELLLTPSKARVVYGSHFEIEDGVVVGYDKPRGEKGRAPLVNAEGDPISFEAALKKIVDADPDKDSIIKSKLKPGAGSRAAPPANPSADEPELRGVNKIKAGLKRAK